MEVSMLDPSTFEYLKPTDPQLQRMQSTRAAFKACADAIDALLPEGPDKTYVLRSLRTCAMWANVAITRHQDGSARE